MDRTLLYVPKVQSFTDDETGEVISGGKIAVCTRESHADNYGIGLFTEIIWLNNDVLSKLNKSVAADMLPCPIRIITEQRTVKGKPRIVDIEILSK